MGRLAVEGITKRFGSLEANRDITFSVAAGEVLAVLGENGAGKSTLMKVIVGLLVPDAGRILVDGEMLPLGDPDAALQRGIGMIHQHFMLVPALTVLDNLILGREPRTRLGAVDWRAARARADELAQQYGIALDLAAPVESLTVGEQQRVEILKAFYRGASILILDEPTALLTPQEAVRLFETVRQFAAAGLSVIFISHKLDEVIRVSDRVMVMRAGRVEEIVKTASSTASGLARSMVGREVELTVSRTGVTPGPERLVAEGITGPWHNASGTVGPVNLRVRGGEIVGIAGIEGNGQHELTEMLVGLTPVAGGQLSLNGTDIRRLGVRERLHRGIGYVPADRQRDGLVLDMRIWENFVLRDYADPPYRSWLGINTRTARARAKAAMETFDIRPRNVELPSRALSGGNQQKLLLAREIHRRPDVLVVSQPTRGLDVGAIEFVHRQLVEMAVAGAGIVVISLELDELLALCDRIVVMFRGQVVGELERARFDRRRIGLYMVGNVTAAAGEEGHDESSGQLG